MSTTDEIRTEPQAKQQMKQRNMRKNYRWPGTYHITIDVQERKLQPLGHIVGDVSKPDDDPQAPRVILSKIGEAVEQELLNSIHNHYPMIEIQDYVIMPDHLHFIVVVHREIRSSKGLETHLGQVISGFKKGCNRRYWELIGQTPQERQGKPASTSAIPAPFPAVSVSQCPAVSPQERPSASLCQCPAVSPQELSAQSYKVPSSYSSGRPPLFSYGYVDVIPLREAQLECQRKYIHNNPRYRLMRQNNPECLRPQRSSIVTALTLPALKGYLQRECGFNLFNDEIWGRLTQRLLNNGRVITCDSYGNCQLLNARLLPVVCHRKDIHLFESQKTRCLSAATNGAILVSARIAKGEQDIIDTAISQGFPVITIQDNGFPTLFHPSEHRTILCSNNKLLIVTPWRYAYRHSTESISVAECKTMNCIVQALCRTKDSWWKEMI